MPFHVYIFEYFRPESSDSRGRGYNFPNLTEQDLRDRIVEPWDRGEGMTWNGRTADSMKSTVRIFETAHSVSTEGQGLYSRISEGEDVTNDWITGPAGSGS